VRARQHEAESLLAHGHAGAVLAGLILGGEMERRVSPSPGHCLARSSTLPMALDGALSRVAAWDLCQGLRSTGRLESRVLPGGWAPTAVSVTDDIVGARHARFAPPQGLFQVNLINYRTGRVAPLYKVPSK
jgi:hypothetical protein